MGEGTFLRQSGEALLGGGPEAFRSQPDIPKVKLPKTISPAEKQRLAREKARVQSIRARGGQGFQDTIRTSPLGTPPPPPTGGRTLIGG
jgi:hypothetical protein